MRVSFNVNVKAVLAVLVVGTLSVGSFFAGRHYEDGHGQKHDLVVTLNQHRGGYVYPSKDGGLSLMTTDENPTYGWMDCSKLADKWDQAVCSYSRTWGN
jgi:hypothetical protein